MEAWGHGNMETWRHEDEEAWKHGSRRHKNMEKFGSMEIKKFRQNPVSTKFVDTLPHTYHCVADGFTACWGGGQFGRDMRATQDFFCDN